MCKKLVAVANIYENGKVVETGYHIHNPNYESEPGSYRLSAYSEAVDCSYNIEYTPNKELITSWFATKTYSSGFVQKINYAPSPFLLKYIAGYKNEPPITDIEIPEGINLLGKSFTGDTLLELYFNVESSTQLIQICDELNITYPVNDIISYKIDNDRTSMRSRSYDLFNLGEGNWVELIIGVFVITDNHITSIKVYEVIRDDEALDMKHKELKLPPVRYNTKQRK